MTAMNEARLTVRSCGPLVSYQDAGRFGLARFGVPASGPMDRLAHAAAHTALGRPAASTAIEVSMGGLELQCDLGAVSFCVAGGQFRVVHAGATTSSWCVRTLRAGETLAIRPGHRGSWAYLAFAGELVCRRWAGHTATHAASGFGGGWLAAGAAITVRGPRVTAEREGELPSPTPARPGAQGQGQAQAQTHARVVLGPQTHCFDPTTLAVFTAGEFALTPAYDRMGVRLAGPPLAPTDALSIASEPILRGSVQVGGDGVATVLLADHQTTGGYPKIATILSCDLDALAQLRPGDRLRFLPVDADAAMRHGSRRCWRRRACRLPRHGCICA